MHEGGEGLFHRISQDGVDLRFSGNGHRVFLELKSLEEKNGRPKKVAECFAEQNVSKQPFWDGSFVNKK